MRRSSMWLKCSAGPREPLAPDAGPTTTISLVPGGHETAAVLTSSGPSTETATFIVIF